MPVDVDKAALDAKAEGDGASGKEGFISSPLSGGEERRSLADDEASAAFAAQASGIKAHTSPLTILGELAALDSPLHAIQIPSEILEVAEELISRSDTVGIETDRLLFLLRSVLYLDRRRRVT